MDQLFVSYCGIGVLVAAGIYLVNRRISLIRGQSINDRLAELSLATCLLRGHWAMPLVTVLGYFVVAAGVVVCWPYALLMNVKRWLTYKPPMSDDELKLAMRELRKRLESTQPLSAEKIEAERVALKKLVANSKV